MVVNLAINVQKALSTDQVIIHCWLDSTVALYWIKGRGDYRQFVVNRVHKIQQYDCKFIWHHVPTAENPADLGSRGMNVVDNQLWHKGPTWLSEPSHWPEDITLGPTPESTAEAKIKQEIFTTAMAKNDALDHLLDKYPLETALRIVAWVHRFIRNCQRKLVNGQQGPISTHEIQRQKLWWIKEAQKAAQLNPHYQADKLQLNLQLNEQQLLEC